MIFTVFNRGPIHTTLSRHTSAISDLGPTCQVVKICLLALLVSEVKEIGQSTSPNTYQTNETGVHNVFNSSIYHTLDNAEDKGAHSLGKIKQRVRFCVCVKLKSAQFKAVCIDCGILDSPHQSHNECKKIKLVNAKERQGNKSSHDY